MHRVQAYIDQHLGDTLVLAELAAVANFSPFHFHRQFTAWMGETLGGYLRRRRLEVAALRLLSQPATPVLNIALMVGFGSGEAFAHAFKDRFGCSASEWRRLKAEERSQRLSKPDQAQGKPDQAESGAAGHDGTAASGHVESFLMNVSVIERPAVRVVYLRHVGPYGPSVAKFWQQRFYPYAAQRGLTGRPCYGISHDDPDITAPEQCRFDICTEVGDDFVATGEGLVTTIPAGTYARLPFLGTPQTIHAAWSALLREWLPASGWQLDGRPTFEYYPPDADYNEATGEFACDIVIPLAPL
jgi:AraC family transcriptional regulator